MRINELSNKLQKRLNSTLNMGIESLKRCNRANDGRYNGFPAWEAITSNGHTITSISTMGECVKADKLVLHESDKGFLTIRILQNEAKAEKEPETIEPREKFTKAHYTSAIDKFVYNVPGYEIEQARGAVLRMG